jgi:hypothetical protein
METHAMTLESHDTHTSEGQLCAELGELLGLGKPVSTDVLNAALSSESYARSLLSSRRTPQMLRMLLASPPKRAVGKSEFSTRELLQRGSQSLLAWSKTGFSTTDPVERQQRTAACLACPDRMASGNHLLQTTRSELGVCGLCGCPLSRKVSMKSETCPGRSTDDPGRNRWGMAVDTTTTPA